MDQGKMSRRNQLQNKSGKKQASPIKNQQTIMGMFRQQTSGTNRSVQQLMQPNKSNESSNNQQAINDDRSTVPAPVTKRSRKDKLSLTRKKIKRESEVKAPSAAGAAYHGDSDVNDQVTNSVPEIISDIEGRLGDDVNTDSGTNSQVSGKAEEVQSTSAGDERETDGDEVTYRVPYYLENFLMILNGVLSDSFYTYLFNDEDLNTIKTFRELSEDAQKLYVRLFSRKFRWVLKSKIVYPKIANDLTDILEELVQSGLILDKRHLSELEDILFALPAPEMKSLAKVLKINSTGTRDELASAITQHSKKQNITSFFGKSGVGGTANMIIKKAKGLLGHAYKLNKEARYVFIRVTMLFAIYKTQGDEDESAGGQQLLFQMLTSNIGRVKYPEYTIKRSSKIFPDRSALLSYGRALQAEADMFEATENKNFDECLNIYHETKEVLRELLEDKELNRHYREIPEFLRTYSNISVYIRVISMGVEVLQSTKQFSEAVEQLKWLLTLDLYHPGSLGKWYERLALNLDYHLKQYSEALDVIKTALTDPRVRTGRRLALWQRAQKICSSPSCKKLKHRWHEFAQDPLSFVGETPKTVIQCQRMSAVVPGESGAWLLKNVPEGLENDGEETVYLRRVEDVVLAHYKNNGYPEGIHGEGGTFRCLFGLFLWDIIFQDSLEDVFYTTYQLQPLDLGTDHFYLQRKAIIDARLQEIQASSTDQLETIVKNVWEEHKDTVCTVVSWDRFESVEHVCGLVRCMGGQVIAGIVERMAINLRHTSGGVPDLVVWNPVSKRFKVVEVKGPNDRLSTKQILWIDYLITLGADAEVCHVEAIGTKRLH